MKTIATIAIAATIAATASTALAGPEYSAEELFEMSDVVADVEVSETVCSAANVVTEGVARSYGSSMTTLDVLKGELGDTFDYSVTAIEYNDEYGVAGCSSAEYILPQGWVGRVYLMNNGVDSYIIRDWGGAITDQEASAMHELPLCEPASAPSDPPVNPPEPNEPSNPDDLTMVQEDAGGCSMGGQGSNSTAWWMLAGLGFMAARRRRDMTVSE